ncbi:MAG: rhodanese-like domain-containing protein, partial [Bacteroidota bacterium]|nr:rhodanese-like domain-containing protein [Bacteroidota bacterium]
HVPFDEGNELELGKIKLIPINTPGHSPDSICVLIKDENNNDYAIATGDTLLVGDVGRPDLRESAGLINKSKDDLARMMYNTINSKLLKMPDDLIVYPAHGAGSLCGKSTSTDTFTTIGKERKENYALQKMSEQKFVDKLLDDQSFVPKYFSYDVDMNRKGAPDFETGINGVKKIESYEQIENESLVIDTRDRKDFIKSHFKGAINLMQDKKFETWLGSIISPDEKFYIVTDSSDSLEKIIMRIAKIGYEVNIAGALVHKHIEGLEKSEAIDIEEFKKHTGDFTIVDVRNKSEVDKRKIFSESVTIPLPEIRERYSEIPVDKPIIVHCAAGFRSAAASSILDDLLDVKVFDLGESIKSF